MKDGVRWLRDEIDCLQSSVSDAETKLASDPRILKWINNREVANEAAVISERNSILQQEHATEKHGFGDHLRSFIGKC